MSNRAEQIAALNLKVIQQDQALRKTQRIIKTVKYAVLARYDEDSHHWNYLKIKGPMFLIVDTFGTYRIVFLNHYSTDNHVILIKDQSIKVQALRLQNNQGFMLNYLIQDSIAGQTIFGIWSADETLLEVQKQIQSIFKKGK